MSGTKRKYEEARVALDCIIAEGRDLSREGRLLKASIIKKFDSKFDGVPTSTWRRMVMKSREAKLNGTLSANNSNCRSARFAKLSDLTGASNWTGTYFGKLS